MLTQGEPNGNRGKKKGAENRLQIGAELLQAAGRSNAEQISHHQAQVVSGSGDRVSLANFLLTLQPGAASAARLQ